MGRVLPWMCLAYLMQAMDKGERGSGVSGSGVRGQRSFTIVSRSFLVRFS
jgi:hypothetical protein